MRWLPLLVALVLLVGCVDAGPTVTHSATPPSGPAPTRSPANTPAAALQVLITPDPDRTFSAVVGRAPFTATYGVNIAGGTAPFQFVWKFAGRASAPDSAEQNPPPLVYSGAGEFQATVTVTDAAGRVVTDTRRIVVLGNSARIPAWKYGVTARFDRRRAGYYPTLDDVTRASELAEAAGIQVVRIDFNWDALNPSPVKWQFEDYDRMVQIVRAHNLDILGVLDYSSWWGSSAQGSNDWRMRLYSEPRSASTFAHFANRVADHFKNDIHAWQVWNEPNSSVYWKPAPNAAHYVALLKETYLAIKYADPGAAVVMGGLSGNGVDGFTEAGLESNFLAGAYAAGARGYFDVMALQPYLLPNSGIAALRAKLTATRAVLDQNGDKQVPLWITEIGAPNDAPWWPTAPIQTEQGVAAWLGQVYTGMWDLSPAIFWYDLQDSSAGDLADQKMGLLRLDLSAKPAYAKLKSLTTGK